MKRLDQITLRELIELCCGDTMVLLCDGEQPSGGDELAAWGSRLLDEYRELADPVQAKMEMIDREDEGKLEIKERCARICVFLCEQKRPDLAVEVLKELDVNAAPLTTPEQVERKCRALLNGASYDLDKLRERNAGRTHGGKSGNAEAIRKSWYGEVAFVMSTLKMSIDPATVCAAVYANLVRQAADRSKQMAKMPPMMGMMF